MGLCNTYIPSNETEQVCISPAYRFFFFFFVASKVQLTAAQEKWNKISAKQGKLFLYLILVLQNPEKNSFTFSALFW